MADLKEFANQLVNLTVKEVNELATILKTNTELNLLLLLQLQSIVLPQVVVVLKTNRSMMRASRRF